MNIKIRRNKGITLIALVMTIIVLIVLSGVSIVMLFSENGIINKSKESKTLQEIAEAKEQLELLKGTVSYEREVVNLSNYLAELEEQAAKYRASEFTIISEIHATVLIDGKYKFLITDEENGNVIIEYDGEIGELPISLDVEVYTGVYDGNEHDAIISVKVIPSDAKIEYALNDGEYSSIIPKVKGVSEYSVSIKASKEGYKTKTITKTVIINQLNTATYTVADKIYTGSVQTGVTGINADITGTYNATNAGTYTAYVTPKENYAWSDGTTQQKTITWKINPSKTAAYTKADKTYTGSVQTGVTGTNVNITGTYSATNAGTYTAYVTPKTNHAWNDGTTVKKEVSWTIGAKGITDFTVTLEQTTYTYDETAKTPTATVKDGSKTLTNGTDYTVTYSNNTNPGTGDVTVTGKGNYTGTKTANFTIEKGIITINATPYDGGYDGTAHPALSNVTTIPEGTTLKYSLNGGTASDTIPTVTGMATYTVSVTASKTNYTTKTVTYTVDLKHTHIGDSINGGACYTPIYHIHQGNASTGGGCYTTAVKHKHTGNSTSAGGCYTIRKEVNESVNCPGGGNCISGPHGPDTSNQVYYVGNCTTCGAHLSRYNSSGYENCDNMISQTTVYYEPSCGKSTSTIEKYDLSCGKTDTTVQGYKKICKMGETVPALEKGDYVEYKEIYTATDWIVLHNNEGGVQIVSADSVIEFTFGGDTIDEVNMRYGSQSSWIGYTSYQASQSKYISLIRPAGTNQTTGAFSTSDSAPNDYSAMVGLGIHNIGKDYWLGGNYNTSSNGTEESYHHYVDSRGDFNMAKIKKIVQVSGKEYAFESCGSYTKGYRAVATLKPELIIGSGDGSKDNPYKLIVP